MTRRFRILLPPGGVLLGLALAYVLLELPYWLVWFYWGVAAELARRPSGAFLVGVAVAYGGYRVGAFHPYFHPAYREWLERSPWTARRPLPAGPVGWVWEDAVILALLGVLVWANENFDPVKAVGLALMSYGLVLTESLFPTGAWGFGYASILAFGLPVWLWPDRWAFLAAAAGANVIARLGLRRSLANFPWSPEVERGWWTYLVYFRHFQDPNGPECGWPHDQLHPGMTDLTRIDLRDAALLSLLAGWWVFVGTSRIADPDSRRYILVLILVWGTVAFGFGRLALYRSGYFPPISLWGRIATFRWIIPGHDKVYIGPVCTTLVPFPFLLICWRLGVSGDVALPACFALMMFVALASRPSLSRWRLTGRHRIVPGHMTPQNGYIQVG